MTSLPSYAVLPPALEDEEYRVYMICTDDACDYCDKGGYDDKATSFNADYEAINDSGDRYEFDIQGIVLLGNILLGTMDIVYSKLEILGSDKEEEATAYFFGTKK